MKTTELSLIPLDALIQEIMGRCDHAVIMLVQRGTPVPTSASVYRTYKGDGYTCVGLGFEASTLALERMRASAAPFGRMPDGGG